MTRVLTTGSKLLLLARGRTGWVHLLSDASLYGNETGERSGRWRAEKVRHYLECGTGVISEDKALGTGFQAGET